MTPVRSSSFSSYSTTYSASSTAWSGTSLSEKFHLSLISCVHFHSWLSCCSHSPLSSHSSSSLYSVTCSSDVESRKPACSYAFEEPFCSEFTAKTAGFALTSYGEKEKKQRSLVSTLQNHAECHWHCLCCWGRGCYTFCSSGEWSWHLTVSQKRASCVCLKKLSISDLTKNLYC